MMVSTSSNRWPVQADLVRVSPGSARLIHLISGIGAPIVVYCTEGKSIEMKFTISVRSSEEEVPAILSANGPRPIR
jgi:hypothetical protein